VISARLARITGAVRRSSLAPDQPARATTFHRPARPRRIGNQAVTDEQSTGVPTVFDGLTAAGLLQAGEVARQTLEKAGWFTDTAAVQL
jgi:hypothetical protein